VQYGSGGLVFWRGSAEEKTCNMKIENLKLGDGLMFDKGCNVKDRKIGVGLFKL
jgi:hypothetical protein